MDGFEWTIDGHIGRFVDSQQFQTCKLLFAYSFTILMLMETKIVKSLPAEDTGDDCHCVTTHNGKSDETIARRNRFSFGWRKRRTEPNTHQRLDDHSDWIKCLRFVLVEKRKLNATQKNRERTLYTHSLCVSVHAATICWNTNKTERQKKNGRENSPNWIIYAVLCRGCVYVFRRGKAFVSGISFTLFSVDARVGVVMPLLLLRK